MTDKVDPTKRPLPAGALQLAPAVEATAPTTRTRLAAPGATSFESDLLRFGDPALQRSLPIRRPVSSKSQRVTGADPAINLHGFTLRTVDEKGPHRDFVSPDRERMMHTLNVAYFHPQIAMRATGLRNRSRCMPLEAQPMTPFFHAKSGDGSVDTTHGLKSAKRLGRHKSQVWRHRRQARRGRQSRL